VRRIACSPVNNRKKNRRRARGGAFLLLPRHSDFDCSTPNVRILGGRSCRPSRRMRPPCSVRCGPGHDIHGHDNGLDRRYRGYPAKCHRRQLILPTGPVRHSTTDAKSGLSCAERPCNWNIRTFGEFPTQSNQARSVCPQGYRKLTFWE
jgi:hypothetical protein